MKYFSPNTNIFMDSKILMCANVLKLSVFMAIARYDIKYFMNSIFLNLFFFSYKQIPHFSDFKLYFGIKKI